MRGTPAGRLLLGLALILLLASCQGYQLVERKQQSVLGVYSVDPQIAWNKLSEEGAEYWTASGVALDRVIFFRPLAEGDTLFHFTSQTNPPSFRGDMRETEIQDFFIGSLAAIGREQPVARGLRPFNIGGVEGFRFEYDCYVDGLAFKGSVVGANLDGRLYLVNFSAARQHYFDHYAPRFEGILNSMTVKTGAAAA